MVELIYTFTSSVKVFLFLYILSSICCLQIFNDGHSHWCEMVSQCGFDLHFSNDQCIYQILRYVYHCVDIKIMYYYYMVKYFL